MTTRTSIGTSTRKRYQSLWFMSLVLTFVVFHSIFLEEDALDHIMKKSISFLPNTPTNQEELHEYDNDNDNDNDGIIGGEINIDLETDSDDDDDPIPIPTLELSDTIYQPNRWGNPLVVEEYKLLFFTIPKVACTEWKLLFRRILNLPDWDSRLVPLQKLHDPSYNHLPYLTNYTREEAQRMLTSDEWTRAVFVREPKERVLSAFMDKFVNQRFFAQKCCGEKSFNHTNSGSSSEFDRMYCRNKTNTIDFTYFLNRTLDCPNPHWTPQADAIDDKWWPYMTFVGYMETVSSDAERLLKSLVRVRRQSSQSSMTAWDEYGKTGWGVDGTNAFMVRDNKAHHATNAHDKLRQVYTKCHEAFVEKHWAVEWNHPMYHFDKIHLFPNVNGSDGDGNDDDDIDLTDCEIY